MIELTRVIGLTGSIATGKSTVAKLFKNKKIPIVDSDVISREIVHQNQSAYHQIVHQFGVGILQKDQSINRKKLASLIFSDPRKRHELNQIVHPIIIEEIIKERDQFIVEKEPLIVLDIPLLYELDLVHLVDEVVVVYTSYKNQLWRLMKREKLDESEAKKRIEAQMDIEEKRKLADYVINNNDSLEKTEEQFEQLLIQLLS